MKFSIVTISYNQAEFLERTIRSVLDQRGCEVEYIIVDPGSTDGSREIIERYRPHFAQVLLDRDEGAADGLNKGFAHATGDIYGYLNSDDTYAPDAFRVAAEHFTAHAETDVICGHAWITDRHDVRLRRAWSDPFEKLFVAHGMSVQIQPSTFIRREAFLKCGGFNKANRRGWDAELLVDLYRTGARIEIVEAFLSNYRLHQDSITNSGVVSDRDQINFDRRFEVLMKRKERSTDVPLRMLLRILKHARRPQAVWERIARGPIQNRGVQ